MSKPSTGERASIERPWEGAGLGLDAAIIGGPPYEAILGAFPDVTPFELQRAMTLSPYLGSFLRPSEGVARVGALREARPGRPDLSDADWEQVVLVLYHDLNEEQRQNPTGLLAAIGALRPLRDADAVAYAPLVGRGVGRPGWMEALFLEHWYEAESNAAPEHRLADIAAMFRRLDGAIGVTPDYLRRLRRRFTT